MYSREVLFGRMLGLVDTAQLDILAHASVAIPGCGGTGYTYAECLARMGVGNFRLSDTDKFGLENMNRQFGATVDTVGRLKSEVLEERLLAINPAITVARFDNISELNVSEFVAGASVLCDTIDFFAMQERRLLHRESRCHGVPTVLCCPVAFGVTGHYFNYHENSRIDFDELFDQSDDNTDQQNLEAFGRGLAPSSLYEDYIDNPQLDFENHKVASLSASCLMATSWGATQAISAILGLPTAFAPVPQMYEFDLRAMRFVESSIQHSNHR